MNDDKSIQLQAATVAALNRIASALEAIALAKAPAPNFVRSIAEYATFEFESIGAKIVGRDRHGVTAVEWAGYQWTRRSPSNKFGSAIWFSRAAGKDEAGNVRYVRLITFREKTEPEPLPGKVAAQVEAAPKQALPTRPFESAPRSLRSGTSQGRPNGEKPGVTYYEPVEPEVSGEETWPTTAPQFIDWLVAKHVSGGEVNKALGVDAKQWLKLNPGKTYTDLAQALSATLAPDDVP